MKHPHEVYMMNARLLSYQHVPPGFEIVIGEKEISPGSKGGIWNLWWNVQRTDEPEAWDKEVKAINIVQRNLGEVTEDLRLIRCHMAEFCRVAPLFPESVDILCKEIGIGRLAIPYKLGCVGRNLLEFLGYHDTESIAQQTTHSLKEYKQCLERWLSGDSPKNPIDAKVSGFLGEVTEAREVFVRDILSHLESSEFSLSLVKDMCERSASRC